MKKNNGFVLLLSSLVLTLLFSFQNCNRIQTLDVQNQNMESPTLASNNNGGSYEGKGQQYYRFATDYTCEGNSAPIGYVSLGDSTDYLHLNNRNSCNFLNEALNLNLLDRSLHQQSVIGYKEGIYELSSVLPVSIPQRIVEFWCRDPMNIRIPEMIVRYNSASQETSVKLYYYRSPYTNNPAPASLPEFIVNHQNTFITKHSLTNMNYGFESTIWLDQPSAIYSGQFVAKIDVILDGQYGFFDTHCRIGGRNDPLR